MNANLALGILLTAIVAPAIYLGTEADDPATPRDAATLLGTCIRLTEHELAARTRARGIAGARVETTAGDITLHGIGRNEAVAFKAALYRQQTGRASDGAAQAMLGEIGARNGAGQLSLLVADVAYRVAAAGGPDESGRATCRTLAAGRPDPNRFVPLRSEVLLDLQSDNPDPDLPRTALRD